MPKSKREVTKSCGIVMRTQLGPLRTRTGRELIPAGRWGVFKDVADNTGRYLSTQTVLVSLHDTESQAEQACRQIVLGGRDSIDAVVSLLDKED